MNTELQILRDYRALLKARLECGCLMSTSDIICNTHGPRDAAEIMLVSCIYMSEHIRHYGTAAGLTTKAKKTAIPEITPLPKSQAKQFQRRVRDESGPDFDYYFQHQFDDQLKTARLIQRFDHGPRDCTLVFETISEVNPLPSSPGAWEALAKELATVWWWCHNNNANLQHGELGWDTTYSICLMGGVPGPDTFHADTPLKVMEQAKARLEKIEMRKKALPDNCIECGALFHDNINYCDTCAKHKPSPHEERVQILSAPETEKPKEDQPYFKLAEFLHDIGWIARNDAQWTRLQESMPKILELLSQEIFGYDNATSALQQLEEAGMGKPGNPNTLRGMVEEIIREYTKATRDLKSYHEADEAEKQELGRMMKEHGALEGEFLPGFLARKDRMLWELIQALSPFYLFATVYKDRHDILTQVLAHEHQSLCVGAFQTARETLSEVLTSCPKKSKA